MHVGLARMRAERYAETLAFFRDVIGVPLVEVAPGPAAESRPKFGFVKFSDDHAQRQRTFATGVRPVARAVE